MAIFSNWLFCAWGKKLFEFNLASMHLANSCALAFSTPSI